MKTLIPGYVTFVLFCPQEGEDSHIFFEPVVPLPEKIEVKTGEEDEKVLLENRAKLYRFVDGEWKERGKGVCKILEHKESGRIRLLMRRDQVCAVHLYICRTMFRQNSTQSA